MDYTFVSVIMPIRNEERFIEGSLGSVLKQNYPPEYMEIIVVDGMSTDRTLEIIAALDTHKQVKIIPNPKQIQASAMNLGIRAARGEIIVRVDGHAVIVPDYITNCLRLLKETGAACVGGPVYSLGVTYMGKAIAAASQSRFAVPSAFRSNPRPQYTDMVFAGAWRKEVLESVGLLNESLVINEDYELNYRIRKRGGKIYLAPELRSEYFGRQSLHDLAIQYFRYGHWKVTMLRQHPASIRPRQIAPPLFVAFFLLGLILGPWSNTFLTSWVIIMFLYFGLDVIFSLGSASRFGWHLFFVLPLVFPIYHFAWGSGFWVGLLLRRNILKDHN